MHAQNIYYDIDPEIDPWSQDVMKIEEQTKESEATCES